MLRKLLASGDNARTLQAAREALIHDPCDSEAAFVAAIALCAGGIGGHRDAIRQEQSGSGDVGGHPEVSMRQEEEQNGDDPQKRPDAWCENAVIDMVRIQGAAARCVPPGRKAYRFQALARQVAALAIDRFGRQSTVVAQALHDLGRVGAKAQSVSGAHPRDAWDFIEAARQAYEDCGTWSGSRPTVWPDFSARSIWRTPPSVAGLVPLPE